jgi:hypothetical protein
MALPGKAAPSGNLNILKNTQKSAKSGMIETSYNNGRGY